MTSRAGGESLGGSLARAGRRRRAACRPSRRPSACRCRAPAAAWRGVDAAAACPPPPPRRRRPKSRCSDKPTRRHGDRDASSRRRRPAGSASIRGRDAGWPSRDDRRRPTAAAAGGSDGDGEGNWEWTPAGWEMLDWRTATSEDSWTCCTSLDYQLMPLGDGFDSGHSELCTANPHKHAFDSLTVARRLGMHTLWSKTTEEPLLFRITQSK